MDNKMVSTFRIAIHIAGDYDHAKRICKQFAWDNPTCVTIKKQCFIYTGGTEQGVEIGLVNYPRFPKYTGELSEIAEKLTNKLIEEMNETSALIVDDKKTYWLSRRNEVVNIDPTKT